jgi:MFS family permease
MKLKHFPFNALRFRDFRLLWIGLLISRIGSEMQVVAINWQVYLLTGSAVSLGLIGLSRFLPVVFFSLLGGMAADIFDRKKVMLAAQIIMASCSSILAFTTFSGHINPLLIYFLIAGNSMASAFDTPARHSMVPQLVPKKYFMNAVSLNTIMWQTAVVLGPTMAGFIIAMHDVGSVYIINLASFLAVIGALMAMKEIKVAAPSNASFDLDSLKHGVSFVRRSPMIYGTMLLDFFATFFSSATVLLPIFAKDILMVGPKGLGLLYAAPSLGAVLAGITVSSLGHFKNQGKILLSAVTLYGLATILFGISRSFYLSLFFLFLAGIGDVISTIIRNTIRQLTTPDYLRGRMVSINMIFFTGGPQLGEVEAGLLAAAVGSPLSVIIGGAGTILATVLLSVSIPKLRKYQGNELVY